MFSACTSGDRPEGSSADSLAVAHDWSTQAAQRDDPSAGHALLAAVTVTEEPDFDRVVFAFRDAKLPGYTIAYARRPLRQCGSGKPVSLAGSAMLEVQFTGAQAHTEGGTSTLADRALTTNHSRVKEAVLTCDFEGHVVWGVGLAQRSAYRVLRDATAGTIVVDVRR